MSSDIRIERDRLGQVPVPIGSLHGAHSERALADMPPPHRPIHSELVKAYGIVKLACLLTNRSIGVWEHDPAKADALERACRELADGLLTDAVIVDRLSGGAGTSIDMNVDEVLANRALQLLSLSPGAYERVSPREDAGLHQSANDTFPTAVRLAAITLLRRLEDQVVGLQEAFQRKEQEFAHVVKVARTHGQDTGLTTLGREMGAFAEAINRDRWRLATCGERMRVVNLGGTTIGSGSAAPRHYIFRVVDTLRELTGVGFARAENLGEATQNADAFVEVSGILKAHATTLLKISGDLRLMNSGPGAGLGEIRLPPRLPDSDLMPGRIVPVIPEAVSQLALLAIGRDASLTAAASQGSLELNPYLPLIAACLLETIEDLARADEMLRRACVEGIEADEARCAVLAESSGAAAEALLTALDRSTVVGIVAEAEAHGQTLRSIATAQGHVTDEQYEELLSPEAVGRLGTPQPHGRPAEE